jgi:hypothetical protein
MDHVALDGTGPYDRHLDDEVVEFLGFSRGSIDICARLSTWNTPTESAFESMS